MVEFFLVSFSSGFPFSTAVNQILYYLEWGLPEMERKANPYTNTLIGETL